MGTALPPRRADEKDPADPRDLDASHAWFVGWAPADRPEDAAFIVLNSCSVRAAAEARIIGKLGAGNGGEAAAAAQRLRLLDP